MSNFLDNYRGDDSGGGGDDRGNHDVDDHLVNNDAYPCNWRSPWRDNDGDDDHGNSDGGDDYANGDVYPCSWRSPWCPCRGAT